VVPVKRAKYLHNNHAIYFLNSHTFRATTSSGATETIILGTTVNSTGANFASTQYQYNNVNELVSVGSAGMTQFQGTTNKAVVSASVVTNAMSIQQSPPNQTTYGVPTYSSATETITFNAPNNGNVSAVLGGTVNAGDVLSIIVYNASLSSGQEQVSYTVQSGDTFNSIATAFASAVNADTNITALGMNATSSSATFSIAQPTTTYSASNSSGATESIYLGNNNTGNVVAEVDGTTTPGDAVTLTTNNPILSGGQESVTYTVLSGDTNITVAAGVAALINADTNLSGIGITATTNAPAVMCWSEEFSANQLTPGWNQTTMSATDASSNTAAAQYGLYLQSPNVATSTYDLNGNMTSDGTNSYQWDAENRLIQINYPGTGNNSQFTYDGLGHCVEIVETSGGSATGTNQFVWCDDERCEARNASGTITAQYFSQGETIGGTNYYYTKEHLGSIREMTNSSGSIVYQQLFDPFGQPIVLASTIAPDFGFAGYYVHQPSGLSLTLTRAYSSRLGRWINRDLIGEMDGGANIYAYVENNPVLYADPLGEQGIAVGFFGVGGILGALALYYWNWWHYWRKHCMSASNGSSSGSGGSGGSGSNDGGNTGNNTPGGPGNNNPGNPGNNAPGNGQPGEVPGSGPKRNPPTWQPPPDTLVPWPGVARPPVYEGPPRGITPGIIPPGKVPPTRPIPPGLVPPINNN
jgi:RHS repeat-associated protein